MSENLPSTINFDDAKTLEVLKATICKDLNPAEFLLAVQFIKGTGLNPFKREVWVTKDQKSGRVQFMTGINGFYEIANRRAEYDGIETGMITDEGEWVKTCVGKWIGAWAKVYRKDRRIPFEAEVLFNEFKKPYGNWQTMPQYMIKKVAEAHALRKSFPQDLNGLYAEEEMPSEYARPAEISTAEGEPVKVIAAPKAAISMQLETTTAIAEGRAYQYDTKRAGEHVAPEQKKIMLARLEKQYGLVFKDGCGWTAKPIPEWSEYLMNDISEPPVEEIKAEKPAKKGRRALEKPVQDDLPYEQWELEADSVQNQMRDE